MKAIFLAYGVLVCCHAVAQTQPAHRPATLYECDVLPSRQVCATWTWNGQAYLASWVDTGAVGIMAVERMDAEAVLIRRTDPSGSTQGLAATYTGRWNGTEITEGKVTWTWNGRTSTNGWTASAQAPPAVAAAEKDAADKAIPVGVFRTDFGGNSARYSVTNNYRAALTAYIVKGFIPSIPSWSHTEDYQISQADPLPNGQNRLDSWIWNGYNFPRQLHVVAAIFADGTAKGVRINNVNVLSERRILFAWGMS